MKVNIPTALTKKESRFLSDITRGKKIYEAGALLGYSTVVIAEKAKHVISVDPHKGYGPTPTWKPFTRNLKRYGVMNKVTPVRLPFQKHKPNGVDVAWADLTGEKEITLEFLKETHRVPLVAIHDYGRAGCKGASAIIDYWVRTYSIPVTRVDTLILLENNRRKEK